MDSNEKFVRLHWQTVTAGQDIYGYGITLPTRPPHSFVGYEKKNTAWQAAREFTEQRREEIRKVERDMLFIQEYLDQSCDSSWRPIAAQSIKGRLQAALAALGQGLKETR